MEADAYTEIATLADRYGMDVRQGWGMTETVAVATLGALDSEQLELPPAARHAIVAKQGIEVARNPGYAAGCQRQRKVHP